jgi:hypothetical protein
MQDCHAALLQIPEARLRGLPLSEMRGVEAQLALKTPLVELKTLGSVRSTGVTEFEYHEYRLKVYVWPDISNGLGTVVWLALIYSSRQTIPASGMTKNHECGRIDYGLMLEPCKANPSLWSRIGMFKLHHSINEKDPCRLESFPRQRKRAGTPVPVQSIWPEQMRVDIV